MIHQKAQAGGMAGTRDHTVFRALPAIVIVNGQSWTSVTPDSRAEAAVLNMAAAELEAWPVRLLRDIEDLKTQLRLCEEHAATMAKDFDASLEVVRAERDALARSLGVERFFEAPNSPPNSCTRSPS